MPMTDNEMLKVKSMHDDLMTEIERLRTENAWLAQQLHDAVNVCYGGVTHDQIDARSFGTDRSPSP